MLGVTRPGEGSPGFGPESFKRGRGDDPSVMLRRILSDHPPVGEDFPHFPEEITGPANRERLA